MATNSRQGKEFSSASVKRVRNISRCRRDLITYKLDIDTFCLKQHDGDIMEKSYVTADKPRRVDGSAPRQSHTPVTSGRVYIRDDGEDVLYPIQSVGRSKSRQAHDRCRTSNATTRCFILSLVRAMDSRAGHSLSEPIPISIQS